MKTYALSKIVLFILLCLFFSCSEQNEVEPIDELPSIEINQNQGRFATVLNDPLLNTGLGFVVEKSNEFQASGRSSSNEFDFSQLEGQEAIKSFDSTTLNTTYVYFINRTDSSLTNFVISEKEGIYLGFFMEYLPNDSSALDDISLFQGQVKISSINGDFSDWMITESEIATNGRSSVCITRTICTQVSVPSLGLYGSIRDCYTTVSCTSFSGNYVAGGLDTGTEDNRDPLSGYGTLTSNSMPEKVPVNNTKTWSRNLILFQNQSDQISNINDYLECFNQNSSASLTIYVDQPRPGTRDTWSGWPTDPDVGHTFISITQGGTTRVLGFYPKDGVNPFTSPSDKSTLVNDEGHAYDIKISTNLTSSELHKVLNFIKSNNSTYNLNSYNCTDFGIQCYKKSGINLIDRNGTWPGGGGSNPGDLGEDIRKLNSNSDYSVTKTRSNAPRNSGNCN